MKTLKLLSTVVVILITFSWTACKKEQSISNNQQVNQARNSGLVEDDALFVSKVPFVISSDLLTRGPVVTTSVASSSKGRKPGLGDIVPPTVSISSPTQGQSLDAASTTVSVSAGDNVGVTSVSLSVNGVQLSTLTSSPYNFSWNAASCAGTTPTLTATAKDKAGNSTSYTITVAVKTIIIILPPPPTTLPSSYISMQTPPVGNQGNEFSCVPFAVVYGARSVEQYYRTGASGYNYATNIFSPEYVYDQTKLGDCGSGASITTCLDFMYNFGVTTWQTVPYSDVNGCTLTPTTAQITEASDYKIPTYSKILSTDQVAIKTMLVANHPVIAGLNIDNNFTNATAGYTWNSITTGNAPHSVIIVGYDDSKNAYRVMNSWGTSWGDAGYLWVDYSVFATRAGYYLYVMNY